MANWVSFSSRSIKFKLFAASCLMSVIPILISLNYLFPSLFEIFITRKYLYLVVLLMVFIPVMGFIVVRQIIAQVAFLSKEAQAIVRGDSTKPVEIKGDDEVGRLGAALGQLNRKIKDNMSKLEDYSSMTAKISFDIQKRMTVLSALLQLSAMISQQAKIDDVLHFCLDKAKGLGDSSAGFILFAQDNEFKLKAQNGLNLEDVRAFSFSEHNECLSRMFKKHAIEVVDSENPNPHCQKFASALGLKNLLCVPIFWRHKPTGVLAIGNIHVGFAYDKDDYELLDIFAKQLSIAVENDFLSRRIDELEIKDALTGLYNRQFIRSRLEEEIKRAIMQQRPCSVILASINKFAQFQSTYGLIVSELALKKIASCFKNSVTEIDRVGRYDDAVFAVILPERNKRQAQKVAEELQKKSVYLFKDEIEDAKKLKLNIGVAENPLDGVNAAELISCAEGALQVNQR